MGGGHHSQLGTTQAGRGSLPATGKGRDMETRLERETRAASEAAVELRARECWAARDRARRDRAREADTSYLGQVAAEYDDYSRI